ncbi:hypothetical protein [Nitrosopumilus sp.]|uniref:hypothetical protein n=1 Tax=Nitrosopumilus sp. TaxID=2024843 RepID=UPI003D14AC17
MPVYASAQSPDRITILDNFGDYEHGEPLFVYGQIASLVDDSFLIMQIINPHGDLCQIQQLIPQQNGVFLTDVIPLKGRICGIPGEYEIKLFYGDYSKSTKFNVLADAYSESNSEQKVLLAQNLVSEQSSLISNTFDIPNPISDELPNDLSELKSVYVDLLDEFFVDELIFEINPLIRPAVANSLDSVQKLLDQDEISFEIAKSIERTIYEAIFYYEINDKTTAINLLADIFVDITNVNPEKTITVRAPSFDELEETLLNLMKKSDTIMNKSVKTEIGFIFARGTAPIYSDELTELIDVLSKARYLDIVSRKQSDLYRLVNDDWERLKPSFENKDSIQDLLESKSRVSELHQAAIILRELADVERFVSSESEENTDLVNLVKPDWDNLESKLVFATSVDEILESESEINQMIQVIEISSRLSKIIEISQTSNVDSSLTSDWESLLETVENAQSIDEILAVVSEFDETITELREKRNPLVVLEFEYKSMKEKAELQADYQNLFLIDNALKILDTAKQMESGNPSITRIDRIEVLLNWASEKAPQIKEDLDSYDKDAFKIRASDILQRAKSLENLVELSLTKNRFLPGYTEFTDKLNEKIDDVRDLVIQNDLEQADKLVRELFDEWTLVSQKYVEDPYGSDVGYDVDELKRIEFREKLDTFSDVTSTFYNNDFANHVDGYNQLMEDAYSLIDLGNFVDAESKITEIGDYLSEYLALKNSSIIYDISYDHEKDIWILNGATEKSVFDRRENLYVTVYHMDGSTHSNLEFTDTKQGNFFTQWNAPAEPGLYVVMLQYKDSKATQIVHVEEEFEYAYNSSDLDMVDLAREFEELESFAQEFGGENFDNNPRFASVINEVKAGFEDKNAKNVGDNLGELRTIIERYLPIRNPNAPIEATYSGNELVITGRILKTVPFSEDLFIDIYNQRGERVEEIALKDDPSGLFNEVVYQSFENGVYVVQLQYHDLIVTDFFKVP